MNINVETKSDWEKLVNQKQIISELIDNNTITSEQREGLKHILDILKHSSNNDKKSIYVCDCCGSDNIVDNPEINDNTNENLINAIIDNKINSNNIGKYFCNDCQEYHNIQMDNCHKFNEKVIGFQVVNKKGDEDVIPDSEYYHPDMSDWNYVYNLSQARKMIKDNSDEWHLYAVWDNYLIDNILTDDSDELIFMFTGDPRN